VDVHDHGAIHAFMAAVGIAVAAVPEGLLVAAAAVSRGGAADPDAGLACAAGRGALRGRRFGVFY
jgi:hypothetical protein